MSRKLTKQNYIDSANQLGCELAAIRAVVEVESSGDGFFDATHPKILFEAHIFSRETKHIYDFSYPRISSRKWNRKLYKGGIAEYSRLDKAKKLNESAALKACSWGLFQIMGFNYKACGYSDVNGFVADMHKTENEHLKAFVKFIEFNNLAKYLQAKDWKSFAKKYNGPGNVPYYSKKLALAYNKWVKREAINGAIPLQT